jgi:ATP/maltotriose-dependent transcriptional regulator MalT
MRHGIEQWQAQGSRLGISYFHALVADAEVHLGDLDAARATLEHSIDLAEEMGEYFWMPEMLRLGAVVEQAAGRSAAAACSNVRRRSPPRNTPSRSSNGSSAPVLRPEWSGRPYAHLGGQPCLSAYAGVV